MKKGRGLGLGGKTIGNSLQSPLLKTETEEKIKRLEKEEEKRKDCFGPGRKRGGYGKKQGRSEVSTAKNLCRSTGGKTICTQGFDQGRRGEGGGCKTHRLC